MQTGSGRLPWSEGWTFQVFPRSAVTLTARPLVLDLSLRFRLSRMFSMSEPSESSATADSLVLERAGLESVQVLPWSLLHIRLEKGNPFSSRPPVGITRVPSFIVIPFPGPGAKRCQAGFFSFAVWFSGFDQVFPSSPDLTIMNCEDLESSSPGSEPRPFHWWVPGLPWVQTALTMISPVALSTRIFGSEQPF